MSWRKRIFSFITRKNTTFKESILSGANLEGADLTGAKFEMTVYDKNTKFPEGFDPTQVEGLVSQEEINAKAETKKEDTLKED